MDVTLLNEFVRLMRRLDLLAKAEGEIEEAHKESTADSSNDLDAAETAKSIREDLSYTSINVTVVLMIAFVDFALGCVALTLMLQTVDDYCSQPISEFLGIYGISLMVLNVGALILLFLAKIIITRVHEVRKSRDAMKNVVVAHDDDPSVPGAPGEGHADKGDVLSSSEEEDEIDRERVRLIDASEDSSPVADNISTDLSALFGVYSCFLCSLAIPLTVMASILFIVGCIWIHDAVPGVGAEQCTPIVVEKARVFLIVMYSRIGITLLVQVAQICRGRQLSRRERAKRQAKQHL